jgi:hypothetical protein
MAPPKGHPAYNVNGEGGAPKRFTEEFINNEADAFIEWIKKPNNLWFEDFAEERDFNPRLLSEWARENDRFREAYQRAKYRQKSLLIKGGLLNKFNSAITKFCLMNCSDMADKQTVINQTNSMDSLLQTVDGKTKEIVNESESTRQTE